MTCLVQNTSHVWHQHRERGEENPVVGKLSPSGNDVISFRPTCLPCCLPSGWLQESSETCKRMSGKLNYSGRASCQQVISNRPLKMPTAVECFQLSSTVPHINSSGMGLPNTPRNGYIRSKPPAFSQHDRQRSANSTRSALLKRVASRPRTTNY